MGTGGDRVRSDRLVSCRDIAGRCRQVIVFGDRCGVVLVAPAGETAMFSVAEVHGLRGALDAAVADYQPGVGREDRQ